MPPVRTAKERKDARYDPIVKITSPRLTFHRFMELPFEIRQLIYNFATRIYYTLNVGALMRCCKTPYRQDDALPAILSVNHRIRDEAFQAYVRVNLIDLTYFTSTTATKVQDYIDRRSMDGSGTHFNFIHSIREPSIILMHNQRLPYISPTEATQMIARCDNIQILTIQFLVFGTFDPSLFESCGALVKRAARLKSLKMLRLIARSGGHQERLEKVKLVVTEMAKKLGEVGREDVLVINAHASGGAVKSRGRRVQNQQNTSS